MMQKVLDFPDQVTKAHMLIESHQPLLQKLGKNISNIVILGMGGSGIVGDFIRVLMRNSQVPVHVHKGSVPPGFLDSNTLVIVITNSGKTRETLDALDSPRLLRANKIVITSSKELESFCNKKNIPWILIPQNNYSRASLGYMLMPVLGILQYTRILPLVDSDIAEAVQILNKIRGDCGPSLPLKTNPARLLADALVNTFPVIYGEYDFTDVVALRWKQQLNENSKVQCYCDVFPELLHNEIEVWNKNNNPMHEKSSLILLRDSIQEKNTNLEEKIEAAKYLAESGGAKVFELWTRGKSELARLLSLSYLGDLVSVYLAISTGIDPVPIHNIEYLKKIGDSNNSKKEI